MDVLFSERDYKNGWSNLVLSVMVLVLFIYMIYDAASKSGYADGNYVANYKKLGNSSELGMHSLRSDAAGSSFLGSREPPVLYNIGDVDVQNRDSSQGMYQSDNTYDTGRLAAYRLNGMNADDVTDRSTLPSDTLKMISALEGDAALAGYTKGPDFRWTKSGFTAAQAASLPDGYTSAKTGNVYPY
jgi:hypothetical protein